MYTSVLDNVIIFVNSVQPGLHVRCIMLCKLNDINALRIIAGYGNIFSHISIFKEMCFKVNFFTKFY